MKKGFKDVDSSRKLVPIIPSPVLMSMEASDTASTLSKRNGDDMEEECSNSE